DSLVVNPHKWMLTPMDCSLLWTSRPVDFRAAFALVPEYLRTPDAVDSLGDYGPALGRRFRALKLWAVLRCYGRSGLQAMIREHVRLAELFEGWVCAEPGWELCAPRPFSVVCFRREGSDEENERLLGAVNATGELGGRSPAGLGDLVRVQRGEVLAGGDCREHVRLPGNRLVSEAEDRPCPHEIPLELDLDAELLSALANHAGDEVLVRLDAAPGRPPDALRKVRLADQRQPVAVEDEQ